MPRKPCKPLADTSRLDWQVVVYGQTVEIHAETTRHFESLCRRLRRRGMVFCYARYGRRQGKPYAYCVFKKPGSLDDDEEPPSRSGT